MAWIALLCVLLLPRPALAQADADAFVRWARPSAASVRIAPTDSAIDDLNVMRAIVGPARMVAYGEPTHGAHEPLAFRNRLFRFLVERMGFTAIAIESGLTESEAIDQYANGGAGDLADVVRRNVSWGFGNFAENHELVAWIRAYNADPMHRRKLHFYGIDLSGGANGALPFARRAADAALDALALRDCARADSLHAQLAPLLERFSTEKYSTLSAADRGRLDRALSALTQALRADPDAATSWSLQNAEVARELDRMFSVSPSEMTSPGIPPDAFRAATVRDSAMAENARWALRREGRDGRILVFAHNGHVMNSAVTGGIWSAFRMPATAMGVFLRGALRDTVVLLGSASGSTEGGMDAPRADTAEVDATLARVSQSSFVLDLRKGRSAASAWRWLNAPHSLRANVTSYAVVAPARAFDAMVFIDTLTPAHTLSVAEHQHDMAAMASTDVVVPKGALYTAADVQFMQGMIAHHAQAIYMSRMAVAHLANARVVKLATKIDQSQIAEIRLMQDWLRRNGQMAPDTSSWRTMHMPGMLTAEQLAQLDAAKGAHFDDLFLTLMIQHHEGALKMVDDLFANSRNAQDVDVSVFANDVQTVQTAEIAIMRQMLAR